MFTFRFAASFATAIIDYEVQHPKNGFASILFSIFSVVLNEVAMKISKSMQRKKKTILVTQYL